MLFTMMQEIILLPVNMLFFYAYDDDYSQHYFIGNSEGMYTSIGE